MTDLSTPPAATDAPPLAPTVTSSDPRALLGRLVTRARSGELGPLPVIAGLVVVWIIFEAQNSVFLTSRNLVQLAIQMAPIGIIALGIVLVLLVGQIDLSVGSTSGLSSAVLAVLFIDHGVPVGFALLIAILVGTGVGLIYGLAFTRIGIPSFVATLAGLLALLGVQLRLLGSNGSINIPFKSGISQFANVDFLPDWLTYVLVAVIAAVVALAGLALRRVQLARGLPARPVAVIALRALATLVALGVVVWYLNRDSGVSWMFFTFLALVVVFDYLLRRTRWGRSLYAVGGNVEAARRAGIRVERIYVSAFVLCSTLAAVGGVLFAAHNVSASTETGTGDVNLDAIAAPVIGGVSLFGGRGNAYAALLGMLVIESISNGLALVSPSPDLLYIVTGLVLLVSVGLDSVARRSRRSSGAA